MQRMWAGIEQNGTVERAEGPQIGSGLESIKERVPLLCENIGEGSIL